MLKYMTALVAMLMLAMTVSAGPLGGTMYKEVTIRVPAGATNALEIVPLYVGGLDDYQEIDRVVALNEGGNGTGVVTFVTLDLGSVRTTLGAYAGLYSGQSGGATLRYEYIGGGQTNNLQYAARRLLVNVSQIGVTNETVYKAGIYTK